MERLMKSEHTNIGTHHPISHGNHLERHSMYGRFIVMLLLSFIAMYILMYAMVNSLGDALPNINQAYMAALMTAPMGLLELALMGRMYPEKSKNLIIAAGLILIFLIGWSGIREQAAVSDDQFLRSMIPHHSGALLMCREAELSREDVRNLCKGIIESQTREINQMRGMLQPR
jgi:hypothetical protein